LSEQKNWTRRLTKDAKRQIRDASAVMSPAALALASNSALVKRTMATVKAQGFAVWNCKNDGLPFQHTIGLLDGKAELVIVGLPPDVGRRLLSLIAQVFMHDGVGAEGEHELDLSFPRAEEFHDMDLRVRRVQSDPRLPMPLFEISPSHQKDMSLMQVMWPNAAGLYPGDEGYDGIQIRMEDAVAKPPKDKASWPPSRETIAFGVDQIYGAGS
jgi:hypothetical protein